MSSNHRSNRDSRVFKLELRTFLELCSGVNSPRAQACYMLALHGEWSQYLALNMPDTESPTFADDYMLTEAMRKNPRLPNMDIDREAVAKQKWLDAETQCRATNELLREYRKGNISFPPAFESLLTKVRYKIAEILGGFSPTSQDLVFMERNFRFGPGATSSCTSANVVLSRKMVSRFDVTPGLYPYWRAILGETWSREIHEVKLVSSNKVVFVPKDAKTDRAIAIEPHVNIFVQLGIGALLRRKLKNQGLDLRNQSHKNRDLARRAIHEGLATIDLTSASDTISSELVWLLLPAGWAFLLDTARTTRSIIDGKSVLIEKFSSMGNGFTFELETLIFWALSLCSGDPNAVAFGDDIIIKQSAAPVLLDALTRLGFSVNTRKTFLAGLFYESCGADYHRGVNVRPLYFKGEYYDFTSAVIRTANKVRLYAHRRNNGLGCDSRFLNAWNFCVSQSSTASRTAVPLDCGDDGLIKNFDESAPSKAKHSIEGYFTRVWRCNPARSVRTVPVGAYLAALHGGTPEISRLDEFQRGRFSGAASKRQLVTSWRDPGPWC